jgi:hypothetical protein
MSEYHWHWWVDFVKCSSVWRAFIDICKSNSSLDPRFAFIGTEYRVQGGKVLTSMLIIDAIVEFSQ